MIVDHVRVHPARARMSEWPFTIPAVAALVGEGVSVDSPVTFLVGENGSGKSTVVEAVAEAWGVDVRGGHSGRRYASPLEKSQLGQLLVLERSHTGASMTGRRAKGYFLRSETALGVFENMVGVPGYGDDIMELSHGESFLQVFDGRFTEKGLYMLDEPEAALSFTACLRLITILRDVAAVGGQVICATHSPILTAMEGANIVEFGDHGLRQVEWDDLEVVQHWRRFLDAPGRYLRYL